MWRWWCAFLCVFVAGGIAEAGQARSSFQVGLTIVPRASAPATSTQTALTTASVPLPKPRPTGAYQSSR